MNFAILVTDSGERQSAYAGLPRVRVNGELELPPRELLNRDALMAAGLLYPYTLERGDRIDNLAAQFLGDSRLDHILLDLNPVEIPDEHYLVPGTVIFIPRASVVESLQ